MRQVHRAAEKLFVDYSGKKPGIVDAKNGEFIEVELFVAVLGASNCTYAEATRTQRGPDWLQGHVRALEYSGGVTQLSACIEDVGTPARRGLDKAVLRQLATCAWVRPHSNVIITGATGVGRAYVACALGQQPCCTGLRRLCRRMPRLLNELALARAHGTCPRLPAKLARIDVLVLDDWGLPELTDNARHDVLEVLEARYDLRSTIMTSQLPVKHWHECIADLSLADALLDRVVHNAYKLDLRGPSRRKENAATTN